MAFIARNTNDIYNEIANELQTQSGLTSLQPSMDNAQTLSEDLTKPSKVAIWRVFSYVIAFITSIFEKNLENFENEITDIIENNRVGNIFWLIGKAKEWQDGDNIIINETTYDIGYETEDITKQIIKFAAIEEQVNGILLKVRKLSSELTEDEYNRFVSYINRIKVAGSRIIVRSVEADNIKLFLNITYTGERDLNVIKSDVSNAISNYLTNIAFNSKIKVSSILSELLAIKGVDDVEFTSASATSFGIPNPVSFTSIYQSYAGWNILDPTITLDDMITYIAKSTY